ncbi:MAG TPA: OmpH family outer membrane protein [Thermodesulfobacteriota bacterium]|nr:OmpH family outer membrane protein [Thermodesulfobacteriota bacterium]
MVGKKFGVVTGMILLGWFGSVWAADLKVAYVDIQRAINECNAGKEAKKVITKDVEKIQHLGADKQKELQTMKESLEKQTLMLTPDARAHKEKEYQTKLRDFQRWADDTQNEMRQKQMEMERTISGGLIKVIQKIGVEEGYTFILERNETVVLYASKAIDVTDRVIKAFDAQKK